MTNNKKTQPEPPKTDELIDAITQLSHNLSWLLEKTIKDKCLFWNAIPNDIARIKKLIEDKSDLPDFDYSVLNSIYDIANTASCAIAAEKQSGQEDKHKQIVMQTFKSIWGFKSDLDKLKNQLLGIDLLLEETKPVGNSKKKYEPLEGEWSNPMTKSALMKKVGIDGYKKFDTFAKRFGLRQAGNRQLWEIRIDKMARNIRKKFENT